MIFHGYVSLPEGKSFKQSLVGGFNLPLWEKILFIMVSDDGCYMVNDG